MNDGTMVQGVLLAHAGMAEGLVDAVLQISGAPAGSLVPLSNEGKSPDALHEELTRVLKEGPAILFTDLPSGSCAITARVCCRNESRQVVIFGVNLPMLLDFVFHRDLPLEELVPRLLEKGRVSLMSFPEYPADGYRPVPG